MPQQQHPTPPLLIYLKQVGAEETCVAVFLFDKEMVFPFTGDGHYDRARDFTFEWNDHLNREWMIVKETHARIMDAFTAALKDLGVDEYTIEGAMDVIKEDAAK